MAFIVQKYGGTSVGSPDQIQNIAQRVTRSYQKGNRLVIVVSAMGETTDELLKLAHSISQNPHQREMDMLLSAGERISMALLGMALWEQGIPALSLTGSQTGIVTSDRHGNARIERVLGHRVREGLENRKVVIVAGFQGVSLQKEITTLGRGGSDTTAVALAASLGADRCEFYKDVDGICSSDPRKVEGAHTYQVLSYELLLSLSTHGAQVLHPRAIELAQKYQVGLEVSSSLNESEDRVKTKIMSRNNIEENYSGLESFDRVGVTSNADLCWVKLTMKDPQNVSELLRAGDAEGLELQDVFFNDAVLCGWTPRSQESRWQNFVKKQQALIGSLEFDSNWVPVTVVGECIHQNPGVLGEVTGILQSSQIPLRVGGSSTRHFTVGVPAKRVEDAVKFLHQRWYRQEGNHE